MFSRNPESRNFWVDCPVSIEDWDVDHVAICKIHTFSWIIDQSDTNQLSVQNLTLFPFFYVLPVFEICTTLTNSTNFPSGQQHICVIYWKINYLKQALIIFTSARTSLESVPLLLFLPSTRLRQKLESKQIHYTCI